MLGFRTIMMGGMKGRRTVTSMARVFLPGLREDDFQ